MILKLQGVRDAGDLEKERLVLRALKDGNAGDHIILCAWNADDGRPLSGPPPHAYWVPDGDISAGSLLVLYTKAGEQHQRKNPSGRTAHFHYWHCSQPIWKSGRGPVIIAVEAYETLQALPNDEEQEGSDDS